MAIVSKMNKYRQQISKVSPELANWEWSKIRVDCKMHFRYLNGYGSDLIDAAVC
jgi:hypothetical protein